MSSPISYPPSVYIENIDWINAKSPSQSNWEYQCPSPMVCDMSDPYSCTTPLGYYDDISVDFVTVIPAPDSALRLSQSSDTEPLSSMGYNELRWLKHEYLSC
eukprot:208052_1